MNYNFSFHNLRLLFVYGLAIALPYNEPFTSINIIGIALTSMYWLLFNSKNKINLTLLKLNIIPIIYIISLIINLLMDSGARENSYDYLERSISILILPLSLNFLAKENRNRIYQLFVGSMALSAGAGLLKGIFLAISNSDSKHLLQFAMGDKYGNKNYSFLDATLHGGNWLTGDHISLWLQTSYFSLYLTIAIALILFPNSQSFLKNRIFDFLLILFLSATIFLVGSRSAIIILIALLILFVLKFLFSKNSFSSKIAFALSFVIFISVIVKSPRFTQTLDKVTSLNFSIKATENESMDLRLQTWKASVDIIQNNLWFGVSPRNARSNYDTYYKNNNFTIPLKQNLNSHNQFLQIGVYWGIGAVFLFILYLLQPAIISNQSFFSFAFTLIILISCLFESVLERLQGIVILSYFWAVLIHTSKDEITLNSSSKFHSH